ncbi:helix-turn-helix transcriptional regulator [Streptococcus tangpeifui]|uniref:helix-turn-helix transcriptional regulator n=2 Tax=Streptococcus tangpeifui TaxID=2709400 RepID=UPI001F152AC7|nr:helix-turn-helix transcriptional regulator [Streptococcus sp. ZJ1593]
MAMGSCRKLSKGRIKLAAGTLYGVLTNLQKKGWIVLVSEEIKERKKKEYLITERGKKTLEAEINRLEELVDNGHKYLNK